MPRPKRTKITSTARVAKTAPPKAPPKPTVTKTTKVNKIADNFSEDSDGLVTKSKSLRPRTRMPWEKTPEPVDEADLVMTGALPATEQISTQSAQNSTPASKTSARTTSATRKRTSARRTSSVIAQEELAQEGDTSGFGDLTFSSFGSESPAHGTRPPSAIKIGATPAHEASILALTNFKRRPRQPSLLRMVQQNTDVEDNDQSGLNDTDNFDFDDFLPHAESTPLNVRRTAPEDEARNDSGTQVSSSGSKGVKRKLSPVVQVPRSSPPYDPPSGGDVESIRPSSPSLPEVLPTREEVVEQTQDDPEILTPTRAPPMSSSPPEMTHDVASPQRTRTRSRRNRSKTAPTYDDSDADETETPAKAKRAARSKPEPKISTAQLKNLLPRRRNRHLRDRDEFDMETSEATPIDSDQDELQMPQPRRRQQSAPRKAASPKPTRKGRGRKAGAPRVSRTYSRRISSDKENEATAQEVEGLTEVSAIEHSEKLAAIRKKFEEVDAFELEFETVDVTTSSSPFR